MEFETTTEELDTETRLQKAFERMIEIKHQKNLLEQEEQQIKDDAFDYLTGVAHTTSGRFVANDVTADVYVSYRPQLEFDSEELQKIKHLEEQLSQAKKVGVIIRQTPYLVIRIIPSWRGSVPLARNAIPSSGPNANGIAPTSLSSSSCNSLQLYLISRKTSPSGEPEWKLSMSLEVLISTLIRCNCIPRRTFRPPEPRIASGNNAKKEDSLVLQSLLGLSVENWK